MRAGDVVWNPLTGEKALLLESAEETAGARIKAEFVVEEGGFVPCGEHVHDNCAEHFDVQGADHLDLDTHPSAEAGLGRLPERVMEGTA